MAEPDAVPALPEPSIAALVAAWDGAVTTLLDLATGLDDAQWATPTACPGWTVGDVVAHVVAIEADLAGHPDVHQPDWAALPHVRDDLFSRYTEIGVDARRGRPRAEVVAELADVVAERRTQLAAAPSDAATPARGPGGLERTWGEMLGMRTFDVWIHLQDLRAALGRPGDLATPAAQVTAARLARALPYVLGKVVAAPAGTSLRVEVSGPVAFTTTVVVGDDRRARAVADDDVPRPTVTLRTDWATFERLAAGRIDPAAAAVEAAGDEDLAVRVLAALAVTP